MVKKGKSLAKARKERRRMDKLAHKLAQAMSSLRKVRDDLWHWCPSCEMAYCHTFTGADEFCHCCYYQTACLKEQGQTIICQECGNVRQFH